MKFIITLCSLFCCIQTVLGQTTSQQHQTPASIEESNNKPSPALPLSQLQSVYIPPPGPTIQLGKAVEAVILPSLPAVRNACAGRLEIPRVSSGPLKLTAATGLKGRTTGDPDLDALIVASAVRNKVDPALLYSMMKQESSFNSRAVSPKGAGGLMQLMPETAARFGVRNVFNPAQNVEAGARYLRFLLDTFGGDVSLALAAYNAGEGNVRKYGKSIPPYPETKKYVSQIRQRYHGICAPSAAKGS